MAPYFPKFLLLKCQLEVSFFCKILSIYDNFTKQTFFLLFPFFVDNVDNFVYNLINGTFFHSFLWKQIVFHTQKLLFVFPFPLFLCNLLFLFFLTIPFPFLPV